MAGNLTLRAGSWTQMLSTELNSLAANTGVDQATGTNAAYDNTNVSNLYSRMRLQINVAFAVAPTAGTAVDFYIKPLGQDGSTRWDDPQNYQYGPQYLGSVFVANVTTLQHLGIRMIPLGYENFTLRVVNSTDQAFAATGSLVYILPEGDAYT